MWRGVLMSGLLLAPCVVRGQVPQHDIVGVWKGEVVLPKGSALGLTADTKAVEILALRSDSLWWASWSSEHDGSGWGTRSAGRWRLVGDTLWLGTNPAYDGWAASQQNARSNPATDTLSTYPASDSLFWRTAASTVYKFEVEDDRLSLFDLAKDTGTARVVYTCTARLGASRPTAQAGAPSDGALAITAEAVRRHVDVIAHDSMQGRATPSPGLEKTAQYVADQFAALRLLPAGDVLHTAAGLAGRYDGKEVSSWIQRYRLPGRGRVSPATSLTFVAEIARAGTPVVTEAGTAARLETQVSFSSAARFAVDTVPESGGAGGWAQVLPINVRVLTGRHTPASIGRIRLDGPVVLYVPPGDMDSAAERRVIRQLGTTANVIVLPDEDSTTFEARRVAAFARPPVMVERFLEPARGMQHWAAYVRSGALDRFLRVVGLDLARLRTDTTPRVQEVMGFGATLSPMPTQSDSATAVNTVAILPGTDPVLRNHYIVISAHMDHAGPAGTRAADSHNDNGADDNASGVAGLIALAKAFSQPGARPRRSLLFLATSGYPEHWGANAFLDSGSVVTEIALPLNINLDMIGRAPGDSLVLDGMSDFEFPTRPDWIAAQHPELALRLADGGSILSDISDHAPFVRRAIPSLYFHTGTHGAAGAAPDPADAVNTEQAVRVLRLIYYITQHAANDQHLPRWSSAARLRRVELFGQ